ncbi:oxidoreductase [Seiridium cupressi]
MNERPCRNHTVFEILAPFPLPFPTDRRYAESLIFRVQLALGPGQEQWTPHRRDQFDDFNIAADGAYDPSKAYGQSKLAQIYAANYVDRHYDPRGLHALSVMPGGILTNLQKHMNKSAKQSWTENEQLMKWLKSPEQGAATTVLASLSSHKRRKWPK